MKIKKKKRNILILRWKNIFNNFILFYIILFKIKFNLNTKNKKMGCESSNEKRHLKNSAQKTVVQLSPTERAILDCKSCRDKIKRYIKNLEQKEQRSKLKVKELLRLKQRDRAKLYLKQSKLFSEQTKIADGQLDMINQQIANIESTSNMNECAEVLNKGNEVLKQLQSEVNIEHWDNIKMI